MKTHLSFVLIFILFGCTKAEFEDVTNTKKETVEINKRPPEDKPNIIVIYTDDHGYNDIGAVNLYKDLKMPNVDALVNSGVRATDGYSTAPQCVPSRAGLLAGRSQNKFGIESNNQQHDGLLFSEKLISERLQKVGYVTAQFGKWHLGDKKDIINHGFDYVYSQNQTEKKSFYANINKDGSDRDYGLRKAEGYHITSCGEAAASIIKKHRNDPLFLYVAFRAPHTPLDAPKKFTDRFPNASGTRKKGLGMLAAVDDGVGMIVDALKEEKLLDNTLIFYIGDNGAPYKITRDTGDWDGSYNDPMNGEKGTLIEGGIRVPYVISWPGKLPQGITYNQPISTLDVAATSLAVAGLGINSNKIDGTNIIPYLTGEIETPPHESLKWRWVNQSAIRKGKWKLMIGGGKWEVLYNLKRDPGETRNLIEKRPDIAIELKKELEAWVDELTPPGLTTTRGFGVGGRYWEYYLEDRP